MKQAEAAADDVTVANGDGVTDAEVRACSVSTFERLQEDIIELEATQTRDWSQPRRTGLRPHRDVCVAVSII